jgi:hypothetical protein
MSINKSLSENVWISSINDSHSGAAVIFTAGSSQRDVVSRVEDNTSLSQNSIVFDLGFADGGTVVGEDDESCFSWSEGSESGLVAEYILSTLDDETEFAVDVIWSDFLSHCEYGNINY